MAEVLLQLDEAEAAEDLLLPVEAGDEAEDLLLLVDEAEAGADLVVAEVDGDLQDGVGETLAGVGLAETGDGDVAGGDLHAGDVVGGLMHQLEYGHGDIDHLRLTPRTTKG